MTTYQPKPQAFLSRFEPWHFECKSAKNTLHLWFKKPDGTSECRHCSITMTVEQTNNCFHEH